MDGRPASQSQTAPRTSTLARIRAIERRPRPHDPRATGEMPLPWERRESICRHGGPLGSGRPCERGNLPRFASLQVPTDARGCPRVPEPDPCRSSQCVARQSLRASDCQSLLISRFQVRSPGGAPFSRRLPGTRPRGRVPCVRAADPAPGAEPGDATRQSPERPRGGRGRTAAWPGSRPGRGLPPHLDFRVPRLIPVATPLTSIPLPG